MKSNVEGWNWKQNSIKKRIKKQQLKEWGPNLKKIKKIKLNDERWNWLKKSIKNIKNKTNSNQKNENQIR